MSRRAPGFTLIELLVGVVVTGVLAGVMFQLLLGQERYVTLQSAQQEVQDNIRSAADLIASELRAVPAGGIDTASATMIRFRLPRAWGLLCTVPTQAAGTVNMVFPAALITGIPASPGASDSVGVAVPGPAVGSFAGAKITAFTVNAAACPTAGVTPSVDGPAFRTITHRQLDAVPGAGAVGGGRAYIYDLIQYEIGLSGIAANSYWLRRQVLGGAAQPLAGPTEGAASGLSFRYFCDTGELTAAQLQLTTNYRFISRVEIAVVTRSTRRTSSTGNETLQDTARTSVFLRNSDPVAGCP